jgi:outer membrane protein assembly factor BamB
MPVKAGIPLIFLPLLILPGCTPPVEEVSPVPGAVQEDSPLPQVSPEDWPWWRGPGQDGRSPGASPPLTWSRDENIAWRATVPGRGHSSPVLRERRVYLTTADEEKEVQYLLSYDRETGDLLSETPIHRGGFMGKHRKNSHASATPACDGERVFVAFMVQGGIWVTATDLKGKIIWQKMAGPFSSEEGYGSSPLLYRSLVIVNGDNPGPGFLAALSRKTGEIVWRIRRPRGESYATPVVAEVAGRPQLLLHGVSRVSSYNPATGELLWHCRGPSDVTACTMAFGSELVYASGGYPQKEILCIRADGSGDVTGTHILWRSKKGAAYVPSPLLFDGLLLVVADGGTATCFDARDGSTVWRKRLRGDFSSSPTLAGGHIFISSESGRTYVLKAGRSFQLAAENDLDEEIYASPAICGGRIFLRTRRALYCIGKEK